jgi:hypothetical protein
VSNGPQAGAHLATAAAICAKYKVRKEAWAVMREGMMPAEFIAALMENRQYVDAVDFLAYTLPPRYGVWWGCLCLQHACGENLTPVDRDALQAATVWVVWPTEPYRAAAQAPARAAGMRSPAGILATGVTMTSVTGRAPLSPARAVANTVKLAASKGDPAKILDIQRQYMELGMGVADGRFRWPDTSQ